MERTSSENPSENPLVLLPSDAAAAASSASTPDEPVLRAVFSALITACLAGAICLLDRLLDALNIGVLLSWGLRPGPLLLLAALLLIISSLRARERWVPLLATVLLFAAAFAVDIWPYSLRPPEVFGEAVPFLLTAGLVLCGACVSSRLEVSSAPTRIGWCLVGAYLLSMTLYNLYSPFEEMHLFWGGAA